MWKTAEDRQSRSESCEDSNIESFFVVIDSSGRKHEDHQADELMVSIARRQKRDLSKRKSVTFADCQEVLKMNN